MLYKFLYGPKAGQVEDLKPGPYLATLKVAGLIEPLPDPPRPPATQPQTTWLLCRSLDESAQLYLRVSCETCGLQYAVQRPKNFVFAHCGVREPIPADINAKGRAEWDKNAKDRAHFSQVQAAQAATEPSRLTSEQQATGALDLK